MKFMKYHGAGNDFLLADNRDGSISLDAARIAAICDRHTGFGADGIMLLGSCEGYDFSMDYYNSDGSGGMMCGNGGRCIVAFARDLGIMPSGGDDCGSDGAGCYRFVAADGPHEASLVSESGLSKVVSLGMKDVSVVDRLSENEFFLDTGTRHYVRFVEGLASYDVVGEGRAARNEARFAPVGANANFVEVSGGVVNVRTYEKGVEDETLACGTGIVASAIASFVHGDFDELETPFVIPVRARISDLQVSFEYSSGTFRRVLLIGPATRVGMVEI